MALMAHYRSERLEYYTAVFLLNQLVSNVWFDYRHDNTQDCHGCRTEHVSNASDQPWFLRSLQTTQPKVKVEELVVTNMAMDWQRRMATWNTIQVPLFV